MGNSTEIQGNANPLFVRSCIALGAIGVLSAFLPYAKDDYESFNGWESVEYLSGYDEWSGGVYTIVLFSVALMAAGLIHFTSSGLKQKAKATGWSSIGVGLFTLGAANATYGGLDAAAIYEDIYIEVGLGLYLGYLVGIGAIVIGILCLSKPDFHRKAQV